MSPDLPTVPDFDRFGHAEAWWLGSALVATAQDRGLPLAIAVDLGEQRVFQAGLPGSTAMNARWADRKANLVRHFDRPSAELKERLASQPGFYERFGLDRRRYAAAEGAVPIRVRGTLVGVVAVSGMDDGTDGELALAALADLSRSQH